MASPSCQSLERFLPAAAATARHAEWPGCCIRSYTRWYSEYSEHPAKCWVSTPVGTANTMNTPLSYPTLPAAVGACPTLLAGMAHGGGGPSLREVKNRLMRLNWPVGGTMWLKVVLCLGGVLGGGLILGGQPIARAQSKPSFQSLAANVLQIPKPPGVAEQLKYIDSLREKKRFGEAQILLRSVATLHPARLSVQLALASSLLHPQGPKASQTQQYAEAELVLRNALFLHASASQGHYLLGRVLEKQGKQGEAAEHYRRAVLFNPRHYTANRRLRALHAAQRAAQPLLQRALQQFKAEPTLVNLTLFGRFVLNHLPPQKALQTLKQVRLVQPSLPEVQLWLARAYEKAGEDANAAAALYTFLQRTPQTQSLGVRLKYGRLLIASKQVWRAKAWLNAAHWWQPHTQDEEAQQEMMGERALLRAELARLEGRVAQQGAFLLRAAQGGMPNQQVAKAFLGGLQSHPQAPALWAAYAHWLQTHPAPPPPNTLPRATPSALQAADHAWLQAARHDAGFKTTATGPSPPQTTPAPQLRMHQQSTTPLNTQALMEMLFEWKRRAASQPFFWRKLAFATLKQRRQQAKRQLRQPPKRAAKADRPNHSPQPSYSPTLALAGVLLANHQAPQAFKLLQTASESSMQRLLYATALWETKRYGPAQQQFAAYVQGLPRQQQFWGVGEVYWGLGAKAKAWSVWKRAGWAPERAPLLLETAQFWQRLGGNRPEERFARMRLAAYVPSYQANWQRLAQLHQQLNFPKRAQHAAQKALQTGVPHPAQLRKKAQRLEASQAPSNALRHWQLVANLQRLTPQETTHIVQLALAQQRFEVAFAALQHWLPAYPAQPLKRLPKPLRTLKFFPRLMAMQFEHAHLKGLAAQQAQQQGNLPLAQQLFSQAVASRPLMVALRKQWFEVLVQQKKWSKASLALENAPSTLPAHLLEMLAGVQTTLLHQAQGVLQTATQAFYTIQSAKQHRAPQFPTAQNRSHPRAEAAREQQQAIQQRRVAAKKRTLQARRQLDQRQQALLKTLHALQAHQPSNTTLLRRRALLRYATHPRQGQSLHLLQAATKQRPKDASLLFALARASLEFRRHQQAKRALERLLRIAPKHESGRWLLIPMLLAAKQWQLAAQQMETSVALRPNAVRTRQNLVSLYTRLKQPQRAARHRGWLRTRGF